MIHKTPFLCAAAITAIAAPIFPQEKTISEEDAWQLGWPIMQGPYGNYRVAQTGPNWLTDLSEARLVWESETRDFDRAKHTTGGPDKATDRRFIIVREDTSEVLVGEPLENQGAPDHQLPSPDGATGHRRPYLLAHRDRRPEPSSATTCGRNNPRKSPTRPQATRTLRC